MSRPHALARALGIGGLLLGSMGPAWAVDFTINVPYEIRNPGPGWSHLVISCLVDSQPNIDAFLRGAMGAALAHGATPRIPIAGATSGTARVEVNKGVGVRRPLSEAEAYTCGIGIYAEDASVVPADQIDASASTRRVSGRLPR